MKKETKEWYAKVEEWARKIAEDESVNRMKSRKWSLAVGSNTGKIFEIVENHVPPHWMLPPCSNQDLPSWVHVTEVSPEWDALVEEMIDHLKQIVASGYATRKEQDFMSKLEAFKANSGE